MFNSILLAKFILKRDRIQMLCWMIGILVFTLMIPLAFSEMFQTEMERMAMAETMSNPAMIAMVGPGFGLDNYTVGAMFAHNMLLFMAITVALMNIFFVVRHTRGDEESGRLELIRSMATGRLSTLMATFLIAILINASLGGVTGLGLYALGIETMDFNGSMLFGTIYAVTGLLFASLTALFVQLSKNTRTVLGYSFIFLSAAYLLRAIGDVSNEILSWMSPLGLVVRTQVYVNNEWWPAVVALGLALIIGTLALYLNSLRDLDAGFIQEKPGRIEGTKLLSSHFGVTLKLLHTSIISWAIGMFILGASYGSVFGDLESFLGSNEMLQQLLAEADGLSIAEQFLPMLMVITSIFGTIPTVSFILRIKSEEKKGYLEHILSRPVSRIKVLRNYAVIAFTSSIFMVLLAIVSLYVTSSTIMDEPIAFIIFLEAGLAHLPAIWVMMAVAIFLIGFVSKAVNFIWLYLGYAFITVYLGGMLQFPGWMIRVSPFGNVPQVPVESFSWIPLLELTVTAIIITGFGFIGYYKRDIGE